MIQEKPVSQTFGRLYQSLRFHIYKKRSSSSLISMLHICQSMLHWVTISNITKQTAERHQQGRGIARLLLLLILSH